MTVLILDAVENAEKLALIKDGTVYVWPLGFY